MAEHYLGDEHWRFDTVREMLDELVYYDLGGDQWSNFVNNLVRYKILNVESLADARTLRVGFKIEVEDQYKDTIEEVSLWIRAHEARSCGAWGRALSTVEGRTYVAQHWRGSDYWMQENPRDEAYGTVLFNP